VVPTTPTQQEYHFTLHFTGRRPSGRHHSPPQTICGALPGWEGAEGKMRGAKEGELHEARHPPWQPRYDRDFGSNGTGRGAARAPVMRLAKKRPMGPWSEYEQMEPDYLLWGCFRWSFASASTPAGCLLELGTSTWPV
jgi:hypothetical protein